MPFKYSSMRERILANSRESSTHSWNGIPCRDWTGSVFPEPWPGAGRDKCYGRISVRFKRGPRKGQVKSTQAHREAAKAWKPWLRIGTKNVVRHFCNRPICVEWQHVTGGEQRTNIRQCVKEGRHKTPWKRTNGERYAGKVAR